MGGTGWGPMSMRQVSRTRGAKQGLLPRRTRAPVRASCQHPASELTGSLCCAPSLPHPGVSRRARSGCHQHHWPGLRAALQTIPQEPAQAGHPPRQVSGWRGAAHGPQSRLRWWLCSSHARAQNGSGKEMTRVPLLPTSCHSRVSCGHREGLSGAARCGASASLFACGQPQSVPDLTLQPGPGWGRSSFPLPGVRRPASGTPFPSPVIYP